MSTIKINVDAVVSQRADYEKVVRELAKVSSSVNALRSQIDQKILSRNNIGTRMKKVTRDLEVIILKAERTNQTVVSGANSYFFTDMEAAKRAGDLSGIR